MMKNSKLIKKIAATVICSAMAVSAFSFAACTGNGEGEGGEETPHVHTYSSGNEWGHNGTSHWRYATCEHTDLFAYKAPHTFENGVCTVCQAKEQVIKPTLTEADDNDPTPDGEGNISVSYSLNASDIAAQTLTEDLTRSIFTVPKGVTVRGRERTYEDKIFTNSFNLGSSVIKVNVPSAGTLKIYVQNGSSGATEATLTVGSQQYSVVSGSSDKVAKLIEVPVAKAQIINIMKTDGKNSTNDIYLLEFETKVPVTGVEKIEVENGGTVDYYIGQEFSTENLAVNAIYETTGRIAPIDKGRLEIDYKEFDSTKSGKYTIGVKYEKGGKTFKAEYTVTVYELQTLSISTYTTNGNKQTTFKQVYLPNEAFDATGLNVQATAKCGEETLKYTLPAAKYTVVVPDLSTAGEKTVTIRSNDNSSVSAEIKIYVVEKAPVGENNTVSVTVDPAQEVSSTNFKTLSQALTYLKNYDANVIKVINVADGEYYEKISIDIPHVRLVGSATNTPDAETNNGVVLWFDALSGITDPSGKAYGTNGSASVTVTSNATDFIAQNITFKNKYNTNALYNESKKVTSDTQAVALLVESGSASFFNCKMTGYHDTLYSNKGSHYYKNCWIEGRTDYIFGQDAHAYFHDCTIYTVSAGEDDGNGGYVAAYQNNTTDFGPIFNGCDFRTPATGATDIALGRAWSVNCKIVIINCDLDGNYSKAQHTPGTGKGQRYVTMNSNEPNPANMLEYNNTGDGSITASIANTCTVIDATTAAAYDVDNIPTILGFTPVDPNA